MNRIVSILLIGLLLFSKVGFSISTHFCGGNAVAHEIVIGNTHVGCNMYMDDVLTSTNSSETQFYTAPCCDDDVQLLHIDHEKSTSSIDVPLAPIFNSNIPYSLSLPTAQIEAQVNTKAFYNTPPLLQHRGYQELYQVYLI